MKVVTNSTPRSVQLSCPGHNGNDKHFHFNDLFLIDTYINIFFLEVMLGSDNFYLIVHANFFE